MRVTFFLIFVLISGCVAPDTVRLDVEVVPVTGVDVSAPSAATMAGGDPIVGNPSTADVGALTAQTNLTHTLQVGVGLDYQIKGSCHSQATEKELRDVALRGQLMVMANVLAGLCDLQIRSTCNLGLSALHVARQLDQVANVKQLETRLLHSITNQGVNHENDPSPPNDPDRRPRARDTDDDAYFRHGGRYVPAARYF